MAGYDYQHLEDAMIQTFLTVPYPGYNPGSDEYNMTLDLIQRIGGPIHQHVVSWWNEQGGGIFPDEMVKMIGDDPIAGYLGTKIDDDTIKYNEDTFQLYVNAVPLASDVKLGGVQVGAQPFLYLQGNNLILNAETDPLLVGGNNMVPTSRAVKMYVDNVVVGAGSGGDMYKSTYDTGDNGVVDDAEKLNTQPGSYYLTWANFTGTPTTLGGYGITDAYIKTALDAFFEGEDVGKKQVDWARILNKPNLYTVQNNADNRVITGSAGYDLYGEPNLTFNGSLLTVTGDTDISGTLSVDIITEFTVAYGIDIIDPIRIDQIDEYTLNAGVTIEGVLLKDNKIGWSYISGTPTTFGGYGISDTLANLNTALSDATLYKWEADQGVTNIHGDNVIYGSAASTACVGNDSRLSNARTPLVHASSHLSSGADTIANFTSTVTGLVPLSGGGTTNYLRADGTWAAPPGSGSMVYPGVGIALSTGSAWSTSITNNSGNWDTAYGWGDHAGLYANISHNHAAGDITSGILGVARGGTGLGTVGVNYLLTGNGTGALTAESGITYDAYWFSIGNLDLYGRSGYVSEISSTAQICIYSGHSDVSGITGAMIIGGSNSHRSHTFLAVNDPGYGAYYAAVFAVGKYVPGTGWVEGVDDLFVVERTGVVKMRNLGTAVSGNILYFNTTNGTLTYGTMLSSGNTDNNLITATGGNQVQGESNLTFDGTILSNKGDYYQQYSTEVGKTDYLLQINTADAELAKIYNYGNSVFQNIRIGDAHGITIDQINQRVGINDETPSYTLDVNGTGRFTGTLTCNSHIYQGNDDIHYFGANNDGQIVHNGIDFYIRSICHGGRILFQGENTAGVNKALIYVDPDGAVGLYYTGIKKLETTSIGTTVTGALTVNNNTDNQWAAIISQDHATGWGLKIEYDGTAALDSAFTILNLNPSIVFNVQQNSHVIMGDNVGITSHQCEISNVENSFAYSTLYVNQNPNTTEGSVHTTYIRGETSSYALGVKNFGTGGGAYIQSAKVIGFAGYFFNDGNSTTAYGIGIQCGVDTPTTSDNYPIRFYDGDGSVKGSVYWDSASLPAFSSASDIILKENINDYNIDGLSIINQMQYRSFNWKKDKNKLEIHGWVAQEVEKIYPKMVLIDPETKYKMVAPSTLIPVMMAGIKQHYKITMSHEDKIIRLEKRVGELEKEVEFLKAS